VNLFETTIRVLGGLLSAYNLTGGDSVMLDKAAELGERLMPAFKTASGVPFSDVNLGEGTASSPAWGPDSSTSEVTTLLLEFGYLSRLTGNRAYEDAASKVMDVVGSASGRVQGLCPIMINPNTGKFRSTVFTLGARGDSYYEYLLKCWVASGRRDERCLRMYKEAMSGVRERLIDSTADVAGLTYVAELQGANAATKQPKMDHLVCFLPGLLALGHYHVSSFPSHAISLCAYLLKLLCFALLRLYYLCTMITCVYNRQLVCYAHIIVSLIPLSPELIITTSSARFCSTLAP
jgi:mannosyl-oligosaccharide alpha-1,2-mannosidase